MTQRGGRDHAQTQELAGWDHVRCPCTVDGLGSGVDRVNEIDIRIAKVLRFGGTRSNVGIDIYNLLNSDAILTSKQTFIPGGQWLRPNTVLTPRFVKPSAQIDF